MTGACIIDGIDISTLGALILRGGDHGLISFPTRKNVQLIDWPDEDGFEVSPALPVYDAKKLTVNYYLKGNETNFKTRLNSFVTLHEASGLRHVEVREFDFHFWLRYAGVSSFAMNRGFSVTGEKSAQISIDYVMDNPLQFVASALGAITANREIPTQVAFSDIDLSAFGIIVSDVYSTAMKLTAKERLVANSAYSTGNVAFTGHAPKHGRQEITVKCTMICDGLEAFVDNYIALFNTMNVPYFTMNLTAAAKQYNCYYSSMDNFKKWPWTGRAMAEFDLKLVGYKI